MASTSIYIRNFRTEIPGSLSADGKQWNFPEILGKNSHGKTTTWKIYVKLFVLNDNKQTFIDIPDSVFDNKPLAVNYHAWIKVDSGLVNGKIKDSEPTIIRKGKNLGKESATNTWCQALRDALSNYKKQERKASSLVDNAQTTRYPPMLAQILKDQTTPPAFPVFAQRKYNGVRTIMTLDCGDDQIADKCPVLAYSRRKNVFPGFEYIKEEIADMMRAYWSEGRKLYLDGEIYKHGVALQDISGQARRATRPGDQLYDYMIYDCFVANEPHLIYSQRLEILKAFFEDNLYLHTKLAETFILHSQDEINERYKQFIDEKYEGLMVRTDTPYKYSYNEHHSKFLLKMKETYDHEFEIIGWETGEKGRAENALMIVCVANGVEFPCTPALPVADRIELAKKMSNLETNGKTHFENQWKGRKIIVYFDEYSKDMVPQRARTKLEFRDVVE